MEYPNIGVIGAGTIGTEVAQSLAQAGHLVVLVDIETEILDRARCDIGKNLKYASLFDAKVRETSHADILSRIDFTTDYRRMAEVGLVVDNSTESWPIKEAVFRQLDRTCPPDCILAANTSAISITRLAGTTQRPDRVIGVHFMNPVFRKAVVEVVKGWHTSDATVEAVRCFLGGLGKRAIVANDMPGFVSNRVLMLAINEAIFVVQDRVATPADVDEIFVKCLAHEMGPLATADLIGLDTVLLTLDVLYESYRDGKFRACPLLRQMVDAGLHGRKSGKGFFDYSGQRGLRWT
ncbi:3-hydroxyacyl-CoA dehydrogenase family protein [Streptosporangium sp. CA-115845]|uniref:3-hydroxyacyl-CoA dehydrogenase family protein n=1 Tax=Streptosporangium sp. CA-115845 TaxID=3240071 RepID=UPI003D8FEAD5